MKLPFATLVAGFVLTAPLAAVAQSEHAAHQSAAASAGAKTTMTNGVVKRVDKAAGTVTIAHEPLTNLGMPAMTMTFQVKDRAWLNGMKEGAKIRFTANDVKGELTVVAVELAK